DGLLAGAAGIVARPLTEGPFHPPVVLTREPLDHDLSMRGDRQAGVLAADRLDRLAAPTAHPLPLPDPHAAPERAGDQEERVTADDDAHGHRLATREVLIPVNATMLARRDVQANVLLVLHHHAVRAGVDPVAVRVLGDVDAAGPDVAAAILRVPERHRELED